jgi:hypothetical protein
MSRRCAQEVAIVGAESRALLLDIAAIATAAQKGDSQ